MAIKYGSKVQTTLNSSSMADMVFLLLIFMLLATTLINPHALRLVLPQSTNQITDKPITTVEISSDLRFYVAGEEVPFSRLEETLRARVAHLEEPLVSLRADQSVPVGEVVKVYNIAKDNRFKLILETRPF
ncbi:MAG: biopolymer transporter ExbD [Rikenellaceae bacterium]|nr:biopolymer transporter ExbD [Rikenellaceae bacterium]MCL2693429.1 biopolymer transporter ExbD [Rikenellaceae bacterium]